MKFEYNDETDNSEVINYLNSIISKVKFSNKTETVLDCLKALFFDKRFYEPGPHKITIYGPARSGKSTFLNLLEYCFPEKIIRFYSLNMFIELEDKSIVNGKIILIDDISTELEVALLEKTMSILNLDSTYILATTNYDLTVSSSQPSMFFKLDEELIDANIAEKIQTEDFKNKFLTLILGGIE